MADPRWLSDDEQAAWRTFLFASVLLHASLDRQLQDDAGMPHAYYVILAMLSEAPGRSMTMTEIAEATLSSPSKTSHAVARLEEKGWVRRRRHPESGRHIVATLTGTGFTVLAAAAPGHVEHVRRVLFDHLTPGQVGQLRDIFTPVLTALG